MQRQLATLAFIFAAVTGFSGGEDAEAAPKKFHGIAVSTPNATAAQFQQMAAGGARTARFIIPWVDVEPTPGTRNWSAMDALMTNAAATGVEVLPVLYGVPDWIAAMQGAPHSAAPIYVPAARSAWYAFVRDTAARYGRGGAFWAEHPELRPLPIRHWQVWNEVNLRYYWGTKPSPRGYADLLRLTVDALKAGDRKARVVLAGLIPFKSVGAGSVAGPRYLRRLFKLRGFRKLIDVVAIHPYASSPKVMLKHLLNTRRTLAKIDGRRLPIWVTEFGWATGGSDWARSPLKATLRRQARWLASSFRSLAKQKELKIRRAYYFTLQDNPAAGPSWSAYMGLFEADGQPKPAWKSFVRRAAGR